MSLDLEALRHIFTDKKDWIVIGTIQKLVMAADRSVLKCVVRTFTNDEVGSRDIVARMSWNAVGTDSGDFEFPSVGDLCIVVMAYGDADQAYVIKMLTSKEDTIPLTAGQGDKVVKAKAEKKLWLTSDTFIYLSSGDTAPTENLVLGQQLKTLLGDILVELADLSQKVSTHTHAGNLGYPTSPPNEAADFITLASSFDDLKASPVDDEAILSTLAFTN